jgi:hypothetical protein
MSKRMNLIKSIVDKDFWKSCIIIKQKIESHNNLVIFDKHFLNLMWSDLVESSISNDKTRYFVTFLCDFIKRSVIYVLRVKSSTFEAFRHFQLHNEHEDNRVRRLRTNWEEKYSSNESFQARHWMRVNRIRNLRAKWNRRTFEINHHVNDQHHAQERRSKWQMMNRVNQNN